MGGAVEQFHAAISGNCNVSRPLACLKLTMAIVITLLCFFGTNTLAFYAGAVRDVPNFQHSPRIDGLACFALNEFNKQQNAQLSFSKVVRAREQMVSGMVYYLTMEEWKCEHRSCDLLCHEAWTRLKGVHCRAQPNDVFMRILIELDRDCMENLPYDTLERPRVH
jgi:hypothetical protein